MKETPEVERTIRRTARRQAFGVIVRGVGIAWGGEGASRVGYGGLWTGCAVCYSSAEQRLQYKYARIVQMVG